MESLYQQMLNWAAAGLGKHPAQTPWNMPEYRATIIPAAAKVIEEICQAYVSWRYGAQPPVEPAQTPVARSEKSY